MSKFNIFFDIPFILTSITLITGVVALLDVLFLVKKRSDDKPPLLIEYARAFFPVFLLVLLIRSFLICPYKVPTGSLEPTVLPGEFLLVNQYVYGLRLPVFNTKIWSIGEPKRGDITLFRPPHDPSRPFVKRVIGLPGDHVVYRHKILTVNGNVMWQTPFGMDLTTEADLPVQVQVKLENLDQVTHKIFIRPGRKMWEDIDVVVPPHSYFMMGDNRDNSNDSREWGVVPEENLIGRAIVIWMSWDSTRSRVRFDRIGTRIH